MKKMRNKSNRANSRFYIATQKNIISMSKRSQGHVEMIISFGLFISALVLLFIFVNPLSNNDSKRNFEENSKDIITNAMSATIGKLTVVSKVADGCYGDLIKKDYDGKPYAEIQENPRVYSLYFSGYFVGLNHPKYDSLCDPTSYYFGIYAEEQLLLVPKIKDLKTKYENNYKELKESLGVSNEFSFNFRYLNNSVDPELSVERLSSKNVERQSNDIPVRVMDNNGIIKEMILNIRLW